jgi:hypothetical protein
MKEAEGQVPKGPVEFTARFEGRRGRLILTSAPGVKATGVESKEGGPKLSFTTSLKSLDGKELDPVWMLDIPDIREVRKVSGLGWKGKLVVGWSTGKAIADGIELVDKFGNVRTCTAIQLRDVSVLFSEEDWCWGGTDVGFRSCLIDWLRFVHRVGRLGRRQLAVRYESRRFKGTKTRLLLNILGLWLAHRIEFRNRMRRLL